MQIDIDFGKVENKDYPIFIEQLSTISFDTKVAIITNPKVSGLHIGYLMQKISAKEVIIVSVGDGEKYKNMQTVESILENLFNHRFDRKSALIAFGGGVIGDMTGFAASIYQRGIDFIQIPTTLLSQVDASVGGKTGINNSYGKNLIGAFYQPKAVHIDPYFLQTLPEREFVAGVAEIVKMAVMFDGEFFRWLKNSRLHSETNIKEAIAKSVKTKAKVVSMDEKESGIRAVLNYGHTFAHVIEHQTNFSEYLHGEAVSIGMHMANMLAHKLGLLSESEVTSIESLLQSYDLPTTYQVKCEYAFYDEFFLDKKTANAKIKFILPDSIGGYCIKDDIDKEIVLDLLRAFKGDH
jgi:3-dehydroquinate synthase